MSDALIARAVLDPATAIFAVGAAWFWFRSASVRLPAPGTYWDKVPETDPWLIATRRSARFNRIAASLAGMSALCSALVVWISLVGK